METKPRLKWQRALTVQRLEFIRNHLDKTDEEIGKILGVGRSAVHFQRTRYKIKKVHGTVQRTQRRLEQMKKLPRGLSAKAVAKELGVSVVCAHQFGKKIGYEFTSFAAVRHFYWQKRFKSLPPLLTVTAVAKEFGLKYGHTALLCHRHKYKTKMRTGKTRTRVPVRHWMPRPDHERWLRSLKPAKG